MPSGLSIRSEGVVDADVRLNSPPWAPSRLHQALFNNDRLGSYLIQAVRELGEGRSPAEYRQFLEGNGVTALDGLYAELCTRVAQGSGEAAFELIRATRQIGTGQTSFDLRSRREDIPHGALLILRLSDVTPAVEIAIGSAFTDSEQTRADHRRDSLALIRELGDGCDVTLVAGGIEQTFLWQNHRDELPPGVEGACNPHRGSSSVAADVETARDGLAGCPKPARILELIGEQPAEVLTYTRITNELLISRGTARSHAKTLRDLGLVSTVQWYGDTGLSLTPVGSDVLDARSEEMGKQSRLDGCVDRTGNASIYSRVNPQPERGEGDGPRDRRRVGEAVEVEHYPRWRDAAVAGCASEGTMRLVDRPEPVSDELRQPYWSYDDDQERVIVGAEYNNPMQWWVCIARALVCYGMFDQALTPERLDGDAGSLAGLLTDDLRILRDGRCLGYLKDADANGEDYADALRTAGEELCALTSVASDATGEERNDLRAAVLRNAHGLAGTVAHLCDLAGIELVREVRLPEFTRRFSDSDRRDALGETLSKGAAIQSTLGHFAAYRQLFEDDAAKRNAALSPDVDASDPHGKMIGSFVLVGDNVSSFEDELVNNLRGPGTLHDDAPEFDVGVAVRSYTGRPAFAQAIQETLDGKNLSPTREAVATMTALTGNPYDVALAINKGLETEAKYPGRPIRADEVRIALRTLDDARLLPNAAPSVGAIVSGLLTATGPISQTDLAERADVSTRSIRTYEPTLSALGLLSRTGDGYRLQISFGDEGETIIPDPITDTVTNHVDLLTDALETVLGDVVFDPSHPVGEALWSETPIDDVLDANPRLSPWVHVALALAGPDADAPGRTTRFGKTPRQTPIQNEVAA